MGCIDRPAFELSLAIPGQPTTEFLVLSKELSLFSLLECGLHQEYLLDHADIIVLDLLHLLEAGVHIARSRACRTTATLVSLNASPDI